VSNKFGVPMMLVLVGNQLLCISGGTVFVSLALLLNAAKIWLVMRNLFFFWNLVSFFSGSGIKITCDGCPYLGAGIGSENCMQSFCC